MPTEVILPKVDMDMSHGTFAVWHVAEGDAVTKGAPLFDIETEKAAMEVESPATGTLHHRAASPGDKVAVGTVVAWIFAEGEAVTDPPATAPAQPDKSAPAAPVSTFTPDESDEPDPAPLQTLRATPAARAAARAAGVVLDSIRGTGPRGRIQRDDIPTKTQTTATWSPQPGPLHISRRAGPGTPILLLHGFTADSQSWAPLEKALGNRALIRIDLPGHGRSPRRQIASFAALARMIVDAFDDAVTGPVHVVGHSLGAALALALADIRAPGIASLGLIAPAGLGPQIDAETLTGITRATRSESLAPWLRRLTADPATISDEYARAAMRSRQDPGLRAAQAGMADALFPDGTQAFDLRPALQRLACPTAILWGRNDTVLPYAQALATPSDAALHLLHGAGHIPHIEIPARVAQIIARHTANGL
jgi:pimeloyl-ACP methyl ester carboxylesterase